ncbi:cystatin-C-like [Sorex araneus]|uniref:cystatin-C-like n=1 Tax=Sorex araneus TaxID=42254 RepID=UPI00243408A1|nr:cystatin-C-like [Sorex araneus]
MASPLRSLLLLAALALAMSSVLCAQSGRAQRLVGGLMDADGDDVDVQRMLSFAMSEFNKMSNDKYLRRPVNLLSARKQVVAGMNYFLEVEIGKTKCTKSQANTYSLVRCPFDDLKEKTRCRFMVHNKPWLNTTTLMSTNCHYT